MKISRDQKAQNTQAFIDAFVAEVRERGYDAVSLRDVARRARMSDGAIYKHFPTKEKILLAYYAAKMDRLVQEGARIAARPGYGFVDRMQALLEFQIGQFAGERDFLEKTFRPTFVAASLMWPDVAAMRKAYVATARGFLSAAEAAGEAQAGAWPAVVDEMAWCHYVAVMLYWLRDGSPDREDTSQFIDRTLQVLNALVNGPLLPMAQDLVGFLVNRHLMPLLLDLGGLRRGAPWGASGAGASHESGRDQAAASAASGASKGKSKGGARGSKPKASRRGPGASRAKP